MKSTTSLVRVVIQIFVDQVRAATRIYEMVKTDSRDSLFFHKIEDSGDIFKIPFVDRESQAHFQPDSWQFLIAAITRAKVPEKPLNASWVS